nr:restriction endonuclease subunit S [uncultured Flavobacterium sp.]
MEKQLPKNWTTTELHEIISYVIGGDWGKDTDFTDEDYIKVLCIRGSEIKNWTRDKGSTASFRKIKKSSLTSRKLELGDILLEISGGGPDQPVGRTVIIDNQALSYEPNTSKVCTNFLRLLRIEKKINSTFINHYLQFFYNSGEITKYQGGSNNLRNLKFKDYETIIIPLPPLAEQNRIVAKLDTLFTQLETIKASMAKIPVLLKEFRQQVLTQAVTGKLTEEWRKGKKIEEWEVVELSHYCKDSFYGPRFSKDDYVDEGFPTVRTTDMSDDGKIILSNDIPRIKIDDPKKIELYKVNKGDLLITRTGSIGKMARYYEDEIVIPSAYLIRFRFNDLAITDFIYYCLISPYGQKQMGLNAVAVTQPNLNAQKIKSLKIPNINIEEQQEIVSRVESLFAKADAIEQQYLSVKEKIDTLPQALLHKAFKGELTEQLESDGDARELLQQIQELKNSTVKPKKATSKKVKKYPENETVLGMVAEGK